MIYMTIEVFYCASPVHNITLYIVAVYCREDHNQTKLCCCCKFCLKYIVYVSFFSLFHVIAMSLMLLFRNEVNTKKKLCVFCYINKRFNRIGFVINLPVSWHLYWFYYYYYYWTVLRWMLYVLNDVAKEFATWCMCWWVFARNYRMKKEWTKIILRHSE